MDEAAKDSAGMASAPRGIWGLVLLRLVFLFVVLVALYIGCQILPFMLMKKFPAVAKEEVLLGGALLTAIVMIGAYRLLVRWTEKRAASEIGLSRSVPLLADGVLVGLGLFCALYAVLWFGGVVSFNGINNAEGLVSAAALALAAAVGEEIVFRGVVFRVVEDGFGTVVALIVSGAIFGLIHAFNKGATPVSTFAIALEAGILLAAAYVLTGSLWFPIGLHFGWNFTEGGIFGAAVSGGQFKGLIDAKLAGPELLTGGAFGPEASVPAVAICLTAAFAMLFVCVARNGGKPLSFRLRDG